MNSKYKIKFFIFIFSFMFLVNFCHGETQYKNVSDETLAWRTPLYLASNYFLSYYAILFIHEGSHAVAGTMLGYKVKEFNIDLKFNGKGGEVLFYKSDKGKCSEILMLLAGPLSERFLAMGINNYLDSQEYNIAEPTRAFLGTTYLYTRWSFSVYFFRTYLSCLLPIKYVESDWGLIAQKISGDNVPLTYAVMTVFAGLHIWDIVNSKDEINKNYDRMMGRYPGSVIQSGVPVLETKSTSVKIIRNGVAVERKWEF